MKKSFFIALLIAFSAHNNFGMFNLCEFLVKSGSNAITNLRHLGGSVIERLQDSSKTKPIALGLVTCIAAYYTIKKYLINKKDQNGKTPLHWAVIKSDKGAVELLLAKGANKDAADNNGETPLHLAAHNGHKEIVNLLLAEGAKVDAANRFGYTPLHKTAIKGDKGIVELLLAKGANKDAADNDGKTPLHLAAIYGHEKVVQELTAAPIVFNKPNNANSELSKEILKKFDNYKELHRPAAKSVTKNMFPIKKDDDESILRALLKLSYQNLKDNPEQERSSFANLFIREFYKNHLLELQRFIATKNNYEQTAIYAARINNKDTIANYLAAIQDAESYNGLNQDLKTKTERNYQQLLEKI